MTTGKNVASDVAKRLRDPKSARKEKELAGSVLAQAQRKTKSGGKGKTPFSRINLAMIHSPAGGASPRAAMCSIIGAGQGV